MRSPGRSRSASTTREWLARRPPKGRRSTPWPTNSAPHLGGSRRRSGRPGCRRCTGTVQRRRSRSYTTSSGCGRSSPPGPALSSLENSAVRDAQWATRPSAPAFRQLAASLPHRSRTRRRHRVGRQPPRRPATSPGFRGRRRQEPVVGGAGVRPATGRCRRARARRPGPSPVAGPRSGAGDLSGRVRGVVASRPTCRWRRVGDGAGVGGVLPESGAGDDGPASFENVYVHLPHRQDVFTPAGATPMYVTAVGDRRVSRDSRISVWADS